MANHGPFCPLLDPVSDPHDPATEILTIAALFLKFVVDNHLTIDDMCLTLTRQIAIMTTLRLKDRLRDCFMVTWDNHPEQSPYRSGENRITMKLIIVMDNTLLIL